MQLYNKFKKHFLDDNTILELLNEVDEYMEKDLGLARVIDKILVALTRLNLSQMGIGVNNIVNNIWEDSKQLDYIKNFLISLLEKTDKLKGLMEKDKEINAKETETLNKIIKTIPPTRIGQEIRRLCQIRLEYLKELKKVLAPFVDLLNTLYDHLSKDVKDIKTPDFKRLSDDLVLEKETIKLLVQMEVKAGKFRGALVQLKNKVDYTSKVELSNRIRIHWGNRRKTKEESQKRVQVIGAALLDMFRPENPDNEKDLSLLIKGVRATSVTRLHSCLSTPKRIYVPVNKKNPIAIAHEILHIEDCGTNEMALTWAITGYFSYLHIAKRMLKVIEESGRGGVHDVWNGEDITLPQDFGKVKHMVEKAFRTGLLNKLGKLTGAFQEYTFVSHMFGPLKKHRWPSKLGNFTGTYAAFLEAKLKKPSIGLFFIREIIRGRTCDIAENMMVKGAIERDRQKWCTKHKKFCEIFSIY